MVPRRRRPSKPCSLAFRNKTKGAEIPDATEDSTVHAEIMERRKTRKGRDRKMCQTPSMTIALSTIQSTMAWPSSFHRPSAHTSFTQ